MKKRERLNIEREEARLKRSTAELIQFRGSLHPSGTESPMTAGWQLNVRPLDLSAQPMCG